MQASVKYCNTGALSKMYVYKLGKGFAREVSDDDMLDAVWANNLECLNFDIFKLPISLADLNYLV